MLVCFVLTLTSMFHPQMALLGFFNNYFGLTMDGFCPTVPTTDPKRTGPVNERTGHGQKNEKSGTGAVSSGTNEERTGPINGLVTAKK